MKISGFSGIIKKNDTRFVLILEYIGSNPVVVRPYFILFFFLFYTSCILTDTKLNSDVSHLLCNYVFQELSVLHWQG
jgi:hypothetical protein